MTTTIDSTVAQNVRHHMKDTTPSEVADWLNITTTETIRLLEGEESFTVDQLATITHRTGVHSLYFVLTPGQQWAHRLRAVLSNPATVETGLWGVLGDMNRRVDVLAHESAYIARELITDALQMVITSTPADHNHHAQVDSLIRKAITALSAV